MIDVNQMAENVKKFKEAIKRQDEQEKDLQAQRKEYEDLRKEFEGKYASLLNGESNNPFIMQDKDKEEKELNGRLAGLKDEEKRIKESKSQLEEKFADFVSKSKKEINNEKEKIKSEARESSIGRLNEDKAKLESEKQNYENRIKVWEENNVSPQDPVLRHLKEVVLQRINKQIADIDEKIEDLRPEKLRQDYKTLEDIGNVMGNLHLMKYKVDELSEVLGIEEQQVVTPAEAQEPEPTSAEAQEPEPTSAEAQEPEPASAEVQEPEPTPAEAQEPEPASAEAQEPEPTSAEAPETEPAPFEPQDPPTPIRPIPIRPTPGNTRPRPTPARAVPLEKKYSIEQIEIDEKNFNNEGGEVRLQLKDINWGEVVENVNISFKEANKVMKSKEIKNIIKNIAGKSNPIKSWRDLRAIRKNINPLIIAAIQKSKYLEQSKEIDSSKYIKDYITTVYDYRIKNFRDYLPFEIKHIRTNSKIKGRFDRMMNRAAQAIEGLPNSTVEGIKQTLGDKIKALLPSKKTPELGAAQSETLDMSSEQNGENTEIINEMQTDDYDKWNDYIRSGAPSQEEQAKAAQERAEQGQNHDIDVNEIAETINQQYHDPEH